MHRAKKVTFPESINAIKDNAFEGCTGLTSVIFPDSVGKIGDGAFRDCAGLEEISLPEKYCNIGDFAFENCTGLTNVTIPEKMHCLWYAAFRNCTALESVTFLGDTWIDGEAFYGCTNLTSVEMPESLMLIEDDAFDGTPWLKKINAKAPDFKIINGVLLEYSGSGGKVTIPDGVVRIDGFEAHVGDIENPIEVVIPDSVREIGSDAFSQCEKLKSISIGSGMELIESGAFNDCTSLSQISLPEDISNIQVIGEAFPDLTAALNRSTRQRLYEMLRGQWVNLKDCLEPQSEAITNLSNRIAGEGTDYEKAKAICTWVSNNIKYDYDHYYDIILIYILSLNCKNQVRSEEITKYFEVTQKDICEQATASKNF